MNNYLKFKFYNLESKQYFRTVGKFFLLYMNHVIVYVYAEFISILDILAVESQVSLFVLDSFLLRTSHNLERQ